MCPIGFAIPLATMLSGYGNPTAPTTNDRENRCAAAPPLSAFTMTMLMNLALVRIIPFAGCYPNRQMVFSWRNRADKKRIERAGGIVRLVEIDNHFAVLRKVHVNESSGAVCLGPGCLIPEEERHLFAVRRKDALKGDGLAVDHERAV